jgi:hypothetical protein
MDGKLRMKVSAHYLNPTEFSAAGHAQRRHILRNNALAGPSDRHERAGPFGPVALVGSAEMGLQSNASLLGQARDELAGRAVAAQERAPVILEVGELRADDEAGLAPATVPPGRTTRRISRTANSGSGTNCSARSERARSKAWSR